MAICSHLLLGPVLVRQLAGQVLARKHAGAGGRQEPLPGRVDASRVEIQPVLEIQLQ